MGRSIIRFKEKASIAVGASVVGALEGKGPLGQYYDLCSADSKFGMDTWEKSEAEMVREASETALKKARIRETDVDVAFAGDLVNQCASSTFGLKDKAIPHVGLYGACSTFALSLAMGALALQANEINISLCCASSHFATAERQYRFPLEYGCQRTPTAQTTVTGAGCVILTKEKENSPYIAEFLPGIIRDFDITDANNMGAAMAPACADTLLRYFKDSGEDPRRFDSIISGDLGREGRKLLLELCLEEGLDLRENSFDCGTMIYNLKNGLVGEGGSGCGCSAVVFSSYFLELFNKNKVRDVLLIGTGALLNASTPLQNETIPAVAHLVRIRKD